MNENRAEEPSEADPRTILSAELTHLHLKHGDLSDRKIEAALNEVLQERRRRGLGYALTPSHSKINRILREPFRAPLLDLLAIVALWTDDVDHFRELWVAAKHAEERDPGGPAQTLAAAAPVRASPAPSGARRRGLAEELFLLRFREEGSRQAIASPAFEIGLAAAVFVELWQAGAIAVGNRITVLAGAAPLDRRQRAFLYFVTDAVARGRDISVSQWLIELRRSAVDQVSQTLADASQITKETRGWGRGRVTYRLAPAGRVDPPRLYLSRLLTSVSDEGDVQSTALAAMVDVLGAHNCIPLEWSTAEKHARIDTLRRGLPEPIRRLVQAIENALGELALTALGE